MNKSKKKRKYVILRHMLIFFGLINTTQSFAAEPVSYEQLKQTCEKLTETEQDGRIYTPTAGELIYGKSHTAAAPTHSGLSGFAYILYMSVDESEVMVSQHLDKNMLDDFIQHFYSHIGEDYINIFSGSQKTDFRVGICVRLNETRNYIGDYTTLTRMKDENND